MQLESSIVEAIQKLHGFSPILLILSYGHKMAITASSHHKNIKRQEVKERFPASALLGYKKEFD